jgi:hypothetical protein
LDLSARASSSQIPGTWGFGLWNDPFSLSLGFGGGSRRFPNLPNAAWFFYASLENYLSFQDDAPAQGFLAQTFRSPHIPPPILALAGVGVPLLLLPGTARALRSLLGNFIHDDSHQVACDVTQWQAYTLEWRTDRVIYQVGGTTVFETTTIPRSPLGLVIWIDNQYLAFPPDGRLAYGTLDVPDPAWLEVRGLSVNDVPVEVNIASET